MDMFFGSESDVYMFICKSVFCSTCCDQVTARAHLLNLLDLALLCYPMGDKYRCNVSILGDILQTSGSSLHCLFMFVNEITFDLSLVPACATLTKTVECNATGSSTNCVWIQLLVLTLVKMDFDTCPTSCTS